MGAIPSVKVLPALDTLAAAAIATLFPLVSFPPDHSLSNQYICLYKSKYICVTPSVRPVLQILYGRLWPNESRYEL